MTIPSHMLPPGSGVMHAAASMGTVAASVNYSCVAALIGIALDYVDTMQEEAQYIWKPLRIDFPKMTFLASRYLSFVFQLFIVVTSFVSDREGSNGHVPVDVCRRRFTILTFAAYTINVIGNANLMQRAYILNMRSRKVLIFLSVLVMAEYGTAAVFGTNTMKMFVFDKHCNATNVPWTIFITMTPKIFLQGAIWALTYSKLERGSEALRSNTKFDGGKWTWFMFHGLTIIFIPLAFTRQCVRPDLVFSWPITIMSIGTCRIVLSSEKIRHDLMWNMNAHRPSGSVPGASADANTYDNAVSRVTAWSTDEPASPPITLTTLTSSDLNDWHNAERSGLPSDTGSTFDGQHSGDSNSHIEIGSERASSSMDSVALRAYWDELYSTTASRSAVWLGNHGVDAGAAQPASPTISLPSLTWSDSDLDHDAEGSRVSSDTGSVFDDGQQSGDSSDRMSIEIGSAHTSSSMDSVTQRAYWDELYTTHA
ncbi:hypothetical protein HYPSUDRAFT_45470 [Hypholoma sublateritium FD-334 SS-4]|uniref:DUF6533 domain-containing protein n=1 Tax=Hypholoma sublateritium (strain FD-334 SS-4) TaxID=945553 RepID=A0A0D2M542_HYPSF|nr:hypothetical protein HYPSUDRAFT_45470 [Hypholoma sublateritium FD-334 SS-4]